MPDLWWLGAVLAGVGSTMSNFGVNCQKLSAMKESKLKPEDRRPYFLQPTWIIGLLLVGFGSLGDFTALAFSPQSIVAPVSAVTLVANIFFATMWLGEQTQNTDYWGTACIFAGVIVSVVFGSRGHAKLDVRNIKHNFVQTPFLFYGFITAALATFSYITVLYLEPKRIRLETLLYEGEHTWLEELRSKKLSQDCIQWKQNLLRTYREYIPWIRIHPFMYCALSGILGGQSLSFAKSVSELIKDTIHGHMQLTSPLFYFFLFFMFFFIFSQIHFINKALMISDALFVVPVFQCFWISWSTLGGLFYYQEYKTFQTINCILYPSGLGLIMVGVYTLSLRSFLLDLYKQLNRLGIDPDAPIVEPFPGQIELIEGVRRSPGKSPKVKVLRQSANETIPFLNSPDLEENAEKNL